MTKTHSFCGILWSYFLAHWTCPSTCHPHLPPGPSSLLPWPVWHPSPFLGPGEKTKNLVAGDYAFWGLTGCQHTACLCLLEASTPAGVDWKRSPPPRIFKSPFLEPGKVTLNGVGERFPGGASGQEPTCQSSIWKRCGFDPWMGKIPWRRAWQLTPVFLPGESHGQRSLVGYGPQGWKELDMIETI